MLQRPTIKPHLRVTRVEGAGVFVLSELRQVILQGRLFELVTPYLDGRPVEQVCQQLAGKATPAQIFYTITALEKKGYLCESDAVSQSTDAAVWTIQDIQPGDAADRLARTTVTVTGLGVDVAPLCEMLEELGVRVGSSGQLDVVLANHYLHKGLRAINRQALDSGRPWILIKPLGLVAWIGPLFEPGKTACWECLAQRILANLIEQAIAPTSWRDNGGTGTIAAFRRSLVVRNTLAVHQLLGGYLSEEEVGGR